MACTQAVICSRVRTAIGAYRGTLKDTRVAHLGAALAIRSTLATVQLSFSAHSRSKLL